MAKVGDPVTQNKSKAAKKLIDRYSRNHLWDKTKILTNPYEFIYFTSRKYLPLDIHPIASIDPLSRSFFKMIEMINTGLINQINAPIPLTTLHLAEGPGGFIEAIIYMRQRILYNMKHNPKVTITGNKDNDDLFYGVTLLDKLSYEVPSWKKSDRFIRCNPKLNILTGIDGTGNLYNTDTLKAMAYQFSAMDRKGNIRRPSIITGDGGFDFSVNHSLQEYNAARLILAQVIAAMLTLEKSDRSVFICKFFDIQTLITIEIIYLLQSRFRSLYIYKPYTSRMANSEKYIICEGYLGTNNVQSDSSYVDSGRSRIKDMQPYLDILDIWNDIDNENKLAISSIHNKFKKNANIDNMESEFTINIRNINHIYSEGILPIGFVNYITKINSEIVEKQKNNILYTINIIEGKTQLSENWCEHMIDTAIKWCQKNKIPIRHQYLSKI